MSVTVKRFEKCHIKTRPFTTDHLHLECGILSVDPSKGVSDKHHPLQTYTLNNN